MAKIKLYWVEEEKGSGKYLTDSPEPDAYSKVPAKLDELDSHDIAEYLDQEAENCNRHDFVGCHKALAGLIRRNADDEAADKVLLALLKAGGLWELD
jgi:hypothetical protein